MDSHSMARISKLEQVVQQVGCIYSDRHRLEGDLKSLFRTCTTLGPYHGTFSGGGRAFILFYLYGVVPINYKGNSYNIPVTIYFDLPYPRSAPRCFVTPPQNMKLKSRHKNVDQGGMIHMPYLHNWDTSSNLQDLVANIASIFSFEPPVHSTTSAPRRQHTPAAQSLQSASAGYPAARAQAVPVVQARPMDRAPAAQTRMAKELETKANEVWNEAELRSDDLMPFLRLVSNKSFVPPDRFLTVMNACIDCLCLDDGEHVELCDLEGVAKLLNSPDLEPALKYLDWLHASFDDLSYPGYDLCLCELVPLRAREAIRSWISQCEMLRQHCSDFWQICEDTAEQQRRMSDTKDRQAELEHRCKSDCEHMLRKLRALVDSAEVEQQEQQMTLLARTESAQAFLVELSEHTRVLTDTARPGFAGLRKEWEKSEEIKQSCRQIIADKHVALICTHPVLMEMFYAFTENAEQMLAWTKIIVPLLKQLQMRVSELQLIHAMVKELTLLERRKLQAYDELDEMELDLRRQRRRRAVAADDPAEVLFAKKKEQAIAFENKKDAAEEQLAQLRAVMPCRVCVDIVRQNTAEASEVELPPAKRAEQKLAELERVHDSFAKEASVQHQERETLLCLVEQGRADAALRSCLSAELLCPILHELMFDPVLASDGHTYERHAIERWLGSHNTSPMTGARLVHLHVYPNLAVKKLIASCSENSSQSAMHHRGVA